MKKKIFALFLLGAFFFNLGFSHWEVKAAPEINQQAVTYLKSQTQNPWITMALAAAGESNISYEYLKNISSEKAIDYAAPILAIAALQKDPRTFGSQDYVQKLKSFWDGNQLGDSSLLNDDIFGLMALLASGELKQGEIVLGTKNYILSKQNSDGGWGWSPSAASDTNMTSSAIMALLKAGVSLSEQAMVKATTYLKSAQNEDGGFAYDPKSDWGKNSDASSDSWVISAIYALGQDPVTWQKGEKNPVEHLKTLQQDEGYFLHDENSSISSFTSTETAYAVVALAGKSYPVSIFVPAGFEFKIQGKTKIICEGRVEAQNALDIVKNAAVLCSFTYVIEDTAYGPYLKKIGDDEAQGSSGWLYRVNGILPSIGAADYLLKSGDDVLWYFSDGTKIEKEVGLKVKLVQTEPPEDSISFSVEPNQIDFGELGPGQSGSKNVAVTNDGTKDIHLEAEVQGADIFQDNIKIEGESWQLFSEELSKGEINNTSVQLNVPANYQGDFGEKAGTIIFWATAI